MDIEQVLYMLMVEDMGRSVDFDTNVIGFRERSVSPQWSELAFGDFTLALHVGEAQSKSTGLSFTVNDLDLACKEVEAGGGKVVKGPFDGDIAGLRLAVVADSEGNVLEFGQHAR
jgi:predicted enzyme related to lactoylglutathione lyase